jgi:Icc-related predicted phosphoesterase
MENALRTVRVAAVGDIHCTKNSTGRLASLFQEAVKVSDVLVLCGDLTDYGLPEEAHVLAKELEAVGSLPVVGVLGNHDFESRQQDGVTSILSEAGIMMLDGDVVEVHGISFAGTKGFGGGFEGRSLQPWGEDAIKAFVREALNEGLKLESALAKCRTDRRVAVLHYSPIAATVEGEPLEIYPFLGSSRLADPIDRFGVTAVFHGHAHHGSPEGRTKTGVPVYNTALPLMRKVNTHQPPLRIIEIAVPATEKVSV